MTDLQKHQDQGTTEQHPEKLEKNTIKRQRAKGHLQDPSFTPGVRRESQGKRSQEEHTDTDRDLLWVRKALREDGKELLKHSQLQRDCLWLPDRKLGGGGGKEAHFKVDISAPDCRSCYHTFRLNMQTDIQGAMNQFKDFYLLSRRVSAWYSFWKITNFQLSRLEILWSLRSWEIEKCGLLAS